MCLILCCSWVGISGSSRVLARRLARAWVWEQQKQGSDSETNTVLDSYQNLLFSCLDPPDIGVTRLVDWGEVVTCSWNVELVPLSVSLAGTGDI